MALDIAAIAKEMSTKYNEDELGWCIGLKRLERQGYGIYRKPITIDDPIERLSKKWEKDVQKDTEKTQESITDSITLISKDFKLDYICINCGQEIKPDSKGRIIRYKDKYCCYKCALLMAAERKKND